MSLNIILNDCLEKRIFFIIMLNKLKIRTKKDNIYSLFWIKYNNKTDFDDKKNVKFCLKSCKKEKFNFILRSQKIKNNII